MALAVDCPHCEKSLKVRETAVGKRVRCTGCQTPFVVPAPGAAAETEPALAAGDGDDFPDLTDDLAELARPAAREFDADEELEEFPTPLSAGAAKRSRSRAEDADAPSFVVTPVTSGRSRASAVPAIPPATKPPPKLQVWNTTLVLLLFIPLAISILFPEPDPLERIERLIDENPQIAAQVESAQSLDELLAAFPDGKFPGAHLARNTMVHWIYALVAMLVYWGILGIFWREKTATPGKLLLAGLVTGTLGILVLLAFQLLAMSTQGMLIRGRGAGLLIYLFLKFIGYSYVCALDPNSSLLGSFFGFTCGVGFCEELVKAVPLIVYFTASQKTTWRGACLMGLATGIGFGVSEGIHYSAEYYNGMASGLTYAVRFCSCVALHAIWSSGVALLMYSNQDYLSEFDWEVAAMFVLHYLLVAMVLHGLYDTLLKKDMDIGALLIAFVSVGWWLWIISGHAARKSKRRLQAA